jgi:hypothetical protein
MQVFPTDSGETIVKMGKSDIRLLRKAANTAKLYGTLTGDNGANVAAESMTVFAENIENEVSDEGSDTDD